MGERRLLGVVVSLAVAAAACGGGGDADRPAGAAGTPSSPGTAEAEATGGADGPAGVDEPAGTGLPGVDGNTDRAARAATERDAAVAPEPPAGRGPARSSGPASPPLTRPDWLGTRVLDPGRPPPPTPPELDRRRLPTIDVLPPPADGAFHAAVSPVPADVAARSTWHKGCPVPLDDLRYVTVSFWGFDDRAHTGELMVHRGAAAPLVGVFERLFTLRFPIEDMRVTSVAELDAPDTGDTNATAAFVCRATRGGSRWSEHAHGLAVDINPFQNPYRRGDGVIPGLASTYLDRSDLRPGMIVAGDGVVDAFAAIGWGWGGNWREPVDHMHFSATGR